MAAAALADPKVAAVFDAYPPAVRAALLDLRRLILEAAEECGVAVVETLKWGQPSYLPATRRMGTTVRIDAIKGSADGYALYVHCQTTLMEQFRLLFPDTFVSEGRRALLFSTGRPVPEAALRRCVGLALTYHRVKAGRPDSTPA